MNSSKDTSTTTFTTTVSTSPDVEDKANHSMDKLSGKWKQQVGNAKILWGKITDDELLKTEGRIQHLAGLVQERYAVSREVAEKQVSEFFAKFK